MRLNKFLARYAGVSRREADRLIEAGEVAVDGRPADLGMLIDESSSVVYLGGREIIPDPGRHYYAVYKPVGFISSTVKQDSGDRLVTELVDPEDADGARLFPMGRLDKDSEGLIILTDDGELMDMVLRSRYGHEKEYDVLFHGAVPDEVIGKVAAGGVDIGEGRLTKGCTISRTAEDRLTVVLTEGMNRQIRRVFERYGCEVKALKRVRFMDIRLDEMKPGESRELTSGEIARMREMAGI